MKKPEQIYFEEHLENAYRIISRQHLDVKNYALNEKANQSIIDKRLKEIAEIKEFLDTAKSFIENSSPENEYTKGFNEGYKRGNKETIAFYEGLATKNDDKETIRTKNIINCKNAQPNLF